MAPTLIPSLLVRVGFTTIILKANTLAQSGKHSHLQHQRRPKMYGWQEKLWWYPSLTTVNGLSTWSALTQQLLSSITWNFQWKRPEMHPSCLRLLNYSAHPHTAQYLDQQNIKCVLLLPHNGKLTPCDGFLLAKLKSELWGQCLNSAMDILKKAEMVLKMWSKNGFQHIFQDWQTHWAKCTQLDGDNFKKTILSDVACRSFLLFCF